MMDVNSVLQASGLTVRKTKFQSPPKTGSYAVWFDTVTLDGPDLCPGLLRRHDITIQLYEYKPDEAAEHQLETALDGSCIDWSKSDREWIQEEQLYMVVYTFAFYEKRR